MRIDRDDFVFNDFMALQYRFSRQSIVIAAEGVHDVIRIGMLLLTVDSRATTRTRLGRILGGTSARQLHSR